MTHGQRAVVRLTCTLALGFFARPVAADIAPRCAYGGVGSTCAVKRCGTAEDCVDPRRAFAAAHDVAGRDDENGKLLRALLAYDPPPCVEESLCIDEVAGVERSFGACSNELACARGDCVADHYCVPDKRTQARRIEHALAPKRRSWTDIFSPSILQNTVGIFAVVMLVGWQMYRKRRQHVREDSPDLDG